MIELQREQEFLCILCKYICVSMINWRFTMVNVKRKQRKAFVSTEQCVACGYCVKVCPLHAISVPKGIAAVVDITKCVGCGKCAKECPASVIEIQEVQP